MSENHMDRLNEALWLLDEARGFAAMSPGGRDNIDEVAGMLPGLIEQAYRSGFVDGEKHSSGEQDYQRGQEADFASHVQHLTTAREWGE
jgi:hypothetical protein